MRTASLSRRAGGALNALRVEHLFPALRWAAERERLVPLGSNGSQIIITGSFPGKHVMPIAEGAEQETQAATMVHGSPRARV